MIYLLDGAANEDYLHLAGLVQFFQMYQLMPESILVGIANVDASVDRQRGSTAWIASVDRQRGSTAWIDSVDRQRDFTHHTDNAELLEAIPTGGSSAAFLEFIQHELQPFIDSEYRTNGDDMLIGQSLGGLLATEALLSKPELFEKYLIVSPSLWWDDSSMIDGAGSFAVHHPDLDRQVFLSIGTEPKAMHEGMAILRDLLSGCGGGFRYEFLRLPDESHATVHHRAVYAGFESFFGEEYPGL
ncbi:MAG: putative alpha/beta superfamily hydrolase [Planctomycetota bacterium]